MPDKNHIKTLPETEEHFRFMAEMLPDMVWTAYPDGYEDYHNSRFTEYTGLSAKEAEGAGWQKAVHPDDIKKTLIKWKECLKKGEPYEIEYRLRDRNGNYKWFLIRAIPWKNDKGDILKWIGTTTDIHLGKITSENLSRTAGELKESNKELARKNDLFNHFVYITAHDLRSPVNNMRVLIDSFKEENDEGIKDKLFNFIENSVAKLELTINSLNEIIKQEHTTGQEENLLFQDILHIVLTDLSMSFPDIKDHVKVNFHDCPSVKFLKPFLISIFKNLLSNSYKYRSPKRRLEISITTKKEGRFVKITFSDNGIGLNERAIKDIFKPYKRFSSEVEGKGIGLFVVKNIIEKNGGKIEVNSREDVGTTFLLYLVRDTQLTT